MSQGAAAKDIAAIKSQCRKMRKASCNANKVLEEEVLVEAGKGPRKAKVKALTTPSWQCDLPAKQTVNQDDSITSRGSAKGTRGQGRKGSKSRLDIKAFDAGIKASNSPCFPLPSLTLSLIDAAAAKATKKNSSKGKACRAVTPSACSKEGDSDNEEEDKDLLEDDNEEDEEEEDEEEEDKEEEDEEEEDEEEEDRNGRASIQFAKERAHFPNDDEGAPGGDSDKENEGQVPRASSSSSTTLPPPPPPQTRPQNSIGTSSPSPPLPPASTAAPAPAPALVPTPAQGTTEAQKLWPPYARIRNGGVRAQTPLIRSLVHAIIDSCEHILVVDHVFPEVQNCEAFHDRAVESTAQDLFERHTNNPQYEVLNSCVHTDNDFRRLALDRLSHAHTLMRAAALIHIAHYKIGDGNLCSERVKLLLLGNSFVYPGHWGQDQNRRDAWVVNTTEAYLSPPIIKTIRRAWFSTPMAFGTQYMAHYKSSNPEKPEREFPISVVALASTAVYAALRMWESGEFVDEPFRGDVFSSFYVTHVQYLETMKKRYPNSFHTLMARLYREVCVKQDPADTTVLLLKTLISIQLNATNPQPNLPIDLDPQVPVTAAAQRINIYNFFSLLREYGQDPCSIPGARHEQLGIRFMRRQGMKKWGVFFILKLLPLILLLSLLPFFAGIIELLRNVDETSTIVASIFIGIATSFILVTTALLALQNFYVHSFPRSKKRSECPYKSPQAWIFYQFFAKPIQLLRYALAKWGGHSPSVDPAVIDVFNLKTWSGYDWLVYRNHSRLPDAISNAGLGIHWLGKLYLQEKDLAEALHKCIQDSSILESLRTILTKRDPLRAESVDESSRWVPPDAAKSPETDLAEIPEAPESINAKVQAHVHSRCHSFPDFGLSSRLSSASFYPGIDCPLVSGNDQTELIPDKTRKTIVNHIIGLLQNNSDINISQLAALDHIVGLEFDSESPDKKLFDAVLKSLRGWAQHDGWSIDDAPQGQGLGAPSKLRPEIYRLYNRVVDMLRRLARSKNC
ncbi:hypothetical protein NP233_g10564 [Leucocoprinus birnbaumii]|uniref:Uncharacterized protein n=1 Tax=Leucocoprinus birnbaumii TaxID=56174 RepID=A0AAD5VI23_9AGAR|nr:hypothetical protein NP233_g10564 [Leucocoprinus birnbaumii]